MNIMDPSGGLSLSFERETPSHWRSRDCITYIRGEYIRILDWVRILKFTQLQCLRIHGCKLPIMAIWCILITSLETLYMYSPVDRLNLIIFSA